MRPIVTPTPAPTAPAPTAPHHHVGVGNARSSHHQGQLPQMPLLTTSISALQHQGSGLVSAGGTPSASLSSPFPHAGHPSHSSYPHPSGEQRGTSPMASRHSTGHASAYNPQEWIPVTRSPQTGIAPFSHTPQHVPESRNEQLDGAPPPYSPRRPEVSGGMGSSSFVASSQTPSPRQAHYQSPVSLAAASPVDTSVRPQQPSSRPASIIDISDSRPSPWSASFPPPPPLNPASHPSSSAVMANIPSFAGQGKHVASSGLSYHHSSIHQAQEGTPYMEGQTGTVDGALVPPSSKRAVSTGAIGLCGVSPRNGFQSGSTTPTRHGTWEPGMPLPGPPPGPPPSTLRSQSASAPADRLTRYLGGSTARTKPRQAPYTGTSLEAVPPTPTGWAESALKETGGGSDSVTTGESITSSPVEISASAIPTPTHIDIPSAFLRGATSRDSSVKGIRQRRSESRSAREKQPNGVDMRIPDTNPWTRSMTDMMPADLPLPSVGGGNLSRRRTITKSTPRTPLSSHSTTGEGQSPVDAQINPQSGSARSTPRPECGRPPLSTGGSIQTPPFSPNEIPTSSRLPQGTMSSCPPKSLPTPPPQQARSQTSLTISPPHIQVRPISHILHLPNEANGIPAPLSPRSRSSMRSDSTRPDQTEQDSFIRDSLDRARAFLEKEYSAEGDEDRLRLFSEYILAESRIRRRRYAQSFHSFDAGPTRENLFELGLPAGRSSSGLKQNTTSPSDEIRPSRPLSGSSQLRPNGGRGDKDRPESMWWANYQPALSPIASMSINDEQSSRGRAPSRWWESQTGSQSGGGGGKRLERSKRESKYMGLPLQDVQLAIDGEDCSQPGPSQITYGLETYPPEKVGWHDDEASTTPAMPPPLPSPHPAIDFSRLVTLPPAYPRHHPAIQNQHPDLHQYRTLVRNVSDLAELDARHSRYQSSTDALRKDIQASIAENARNFRANIQAQIQEGGISYAEAAEAEAAMKADQQASQKRGVQAEFDSFQDVILNPLHNLLNSRIDQTSRHLDELRGKLLNDARLHSPNETLTAGDERPELLEQLTQFKWLFEAREQLHREVFKLLTERNEKYQAVVTLPYHQSGHKEDKIRETVAFFAQDTHDRTVAFETAVLKRHTDFLSVIENNVLRGVEAQLSAFWDIAPALLAICQKIPDRSPHQQASSGWPGIQIPREELQENPSYRDFPMQYLYSLLLHAERSTYQFIESQINLLCLLHEVKTGVMAAQVRCWEVDRLACPPSSSSPISSPSSSPPPPPSSITATAASSTSTSFSSLPPSNPSNPSIFADHQPKTKTDPESSAHYERIKRQAIQKRRSEEKSLTADLKDRVATVEGQWADALGSVITGTRDRVKTWLVDEGGWDGELLDVG